MMGFDGKEVHQKLGVVISLSEDELQNYSEFLIIVDQDYVTNTLIPAINSSGQALA